MQGPFACAIDFGTSNSLIALASREGAQPPLDVDPLNHDAKIMRSIYFISDEGRWSFGAEAVDLYSTNGGQGRLIRSIKKYLPDESFRTTNVGGQKVSLVDIVSFFLRNLRDKANAAAGCEVDTVVLGRPALFSLNKERDALAQNRLQAAAKQAGFNEIHFCPEPIAAGLAIEGDEQQSGKLVAICDFGGGTSDFTVLRFKQNKEFDVLGLGGCSLAGDHYDGSIMKHSISPMLGADISYKMPSGSNILHLPKHIINKLCSAPDINFIGQSETFELLQAVGDWSLDREKKARFEKLIYIIEERLGYKLFESIEQSKIKLSAEDSALFDFRHFDFSVSGTLLGSDFRDFSADITKKILASLDDTIAQTGVKHEQIDAIVCTGGTTRIPSLLTGLTDRFAPEKIRRSHAFHSVINGLAHRAADVLRRAGE